MSMEFPAAKSLSSLTRDARKFFRELYTKLHAMLCSFTGPVRRSLRNKQFLARPNYCYSRHPDMSRAACCRSAERWRPHLRARLAPSTTCPPDSWTFADLEPSSDAVGSRSEALTAHRDCQTTQRAAACPAADIPSAHGSSVASPATYQKT